MKLPSTDAIEQWQNDLCLLILFMVSLNDCCFVFLGKVTVFFNTSLMYVSGISISVTMLNYLGTEPTSLALATRLLTTTPGRHYQEWSWIRDYSTTWTNIFELQVHNLFNVHYRIRLSSDITSIDPQTFKSLFEWWKRTSVSKEKPTASGAQTQDLCITSLQTLTSKPYCTSRPFCFRMLHWTFKLH